jgi:HK97 family phage portal protein
MGLLSRFFRKADPVVISTPEELAAVIGATWDSSAGVAVSPETAMRFSTVYACVRVIAESIGALPLVLYRDNGAKGERETRHPLHRVLTVAPNPYMTPAEFKELMASCLASNGNFYAYKVWALGELVELLPIDPSRVAPKLREDWSVVYEVTFPDARRAVLTQDELWHVRLFGRDGLLGRSPISQAREDIGAAIAAQRMGGASFKNGSKLSGVLHTDGTLKDDAYQRIRASWQDTYGGVDNANKVAILEGGLKFQSVQMSAADAQWIESRKMSRSEIAGTFRVPPHKIGDLERATFSNIEHQAQEFVTDCLLPYLVKIEQRINAGLLPKEDVGRYYAKFTLNGLLRGDAKSRAEFYTRMVQNGAMSPNEIRALEDMNPRDGGDIYLTPLNMAVNGQPIKEQSA